LLQPPAGSRAVTQKRFTDIVQQQARAFLSPSSTNGKSAMRYVTSLRKRTMAVAVASGALLFLAGFAHGYNGQEPEPRWHSISAER
jgi:hypothetical protein